MLAGMVVIQNLLRLWEAGPSYFPYPSGTIAEKDHLASSGHAALQRRLAHQRAKLIGADKPPQIGRAVRIANRLACFIDDGLSENRSQSHLTRFGFAIGAFADPALRFLAYHGHARAVHTHIKLR